MMAFTKAVRIFECLQVSGSGRRDRAWKKNSFQMLRWEVMVK